jgi:hypothetical protein
MTTAEKREALNRAGYRERYAMENGKATKRIMNGHTLYIFRYSNKIEYQDANGATYDATRKAWIN